jgi:threonine/homoserine/homoserine lactone efflux protein
VVLRNILSEKKTLSFHSKTSPFLKTLIIYFVTAIISYVATIPPGPLSLYVVHTTLQRNIKIALWIALGGIIGESFYTYLATEGVMIFDKYPMVLYWSQWGIIVLLTIVGLITFFQKDKPIEATQILVHSPFFSMFKGISLSLFTPALFPFWVVVLVAYKDYNWLHINTLLEKISFVLGAETGTFLLVYTYSYIAHRKRNLIFKYLSDSRLNKVIGLLYLGLAVWQLVNMLGGK